MLRSLILSTTSLFLLGTSALQIGGNRVQLKPYKRDHLQNLVGESFYAWVYSLTIFR